MHLGSIQTPPKATLSVIALKWEINSKTTKPKASIFGMQHCYVELSVNHTKHSPGAKKGPRSSLATLALQSEKTQKQSFLKSQGLEHLHFMSSYV